MPFFHFCCAAMFLFALCFEGDAMAASYEGVVTPENHVQSLNIDNKIAADCPAVASRNPLVVMGIGQSLIANQNGDNAWDLVSHRNVYELWAGKCYRASGPLYGATGGQQSFMLPLADMITRATGRDVVIIMAAIGSSPASKFLPGQSVGDLIGDQIADAGTIGFKPSIVLFEQGQSDVIDHTDPGDYRKTLSSIVADIKEKAAGAPIFVATDTMVSWTPSPDIASGQKEITKTDGVFPGPNIDLIKYRIDGAHMDNRGVQMQAAMWFQVLANHFGW
ncbi:SGNH/GDSL hydrolase family protein [Rhizobium sp. CNPSo 4039]|uniref:SGNH/GDSL hydrolase family protein n=1 Tax=Rhizobium sp. CNPSo 4039 TaxID=3021409 RepID=UPI00254FEE3D|nr:SGNH/GDSL hydrolase family protein [Rhizobium sp. CNPSo 4039]MDK4712978.1 SGNH/GDSL hydrolase family protein [Rhizobium sp. CNPSo 4039]